MGRVSPYRGSGDDVSSSFKWDRDRHHLTVMPEKRVPGAVNLHAYDSSDDVGVELEVPPHEVAALAKALAEGMCEAAGLPAPVILDRPEIDPEGAAGINVFTVRLDRDLSVCVAGRAGHASPVAPSVARKLASVIAAYADAAEAARNEPDETEVDELAAVIRSELHPPAASMGLRPSESDRTAARAALRWFREREDGRDGE
jgi:hypothetical protein